MKVFSIKNSNSSALNKVDFKDEKEIHDFTENNLAEFNLELIAREFEVANRRFDTLAFNVETNSFVIIEYKNKLSYSVIDQGFYYLSLMLNNRAKLILKYNGLKAVSLKEKDINWENSRLLFIAPLYSEHQKGAINFKDLPIELWQIQKFVDKNNTAIIIYNNIKPENTEASIKTITSKNSEFNQVTKEIKTYIEEDHLKKTSNELQELYKTIKEKILDLGDIEVKFNKTYISFKGKKNIVDIEFGTKQLKIYLNLEYKQLKNIDNIFKDVTGVGHLGMGDCQLIVKNIEDVDITYFMSCVEQSYKENR